MTPTDIIALLRDVLTDLDGGIVTRICRTRRRREAVARLRSGLAVLEDRSGPSDVVDEVRLAWRDDHRVRVDAAGMTTIDASGIWVRAWLLADGGHIGLDLIDPDQLANALAALPLIPREIFLLHREEGLDYHAIASRLGLTVDEVEAEFARGLAIFTAQVMKGR